MTKQKLAQKRAGQTRGLGSRSGRHRPPRERWEEARGGRRPRPTMEDPSPDDAGQKTVRRSRRAGRDEGGSRTLRRSAGGCTKESVCPSSACTLLTQCASQTASDWLLALSRLCLHSLARMGSQEGPRTFSGQRRCLSLGPANVVVSCHQCGTSAASRHRQL